MGETDKPQDALHSAGKKDSFEDELEEYDLLRPKAADNAVKTDLTRTAKAFNTRIQRIKKEQEVETEQAEKAARTRHMLMLRALMNIRKSLREVIRVDLGERFSLKLIADDWAGWPRLTVNLNELDAEEAEYFAFVVTAHDRAETGMLEILFSNRVPPERISVVRDSDIKRLPALLRKCVRTYLDYVGEIVLHADRKQQSLADNTAELQNKQIAEFQEKMSHGDPQVLDGDLFSEDYERDFLETLPSMDEVETLPGVEREKS